MEVLSPQYHWFFLEAKAVMVEVEEPVLSETHGLGEPSQAGGYLMTLAKRVQENMAPLGSGLSGKT